MQIMGNQQDPAIQTIANVINQFVERDFTIEIDTLHRFVQHQKIRCPQNCTRQQNALKLTAGQLAHLGVGKMQRLG